MSKVVSLRLKNDLLESLNRAARRLGRTPSETAAVLLGEALRQRDFAFIEFRDSPVGRQAYIQGTRLSVWQVLSTVRAYDGHVDEAAAHLSIPTVQIKAALRYAEAFGDEIEAAIEDNDVSAVELKRLIPNLEVFKASATPA